VQVCPGVIYIQCPHIFLLLSTTGGRRFASLSSCVAKPPKVMAAPFGHSHLISYECLGDSSPSVFMPFHTNTNGHSIFLILQPWKWFSTALLFDKHHCHDFERALPCS